MTKQETLVTELVNRPEYAGMTDEQIWEAVNASTVEVIGEASSSLLNKWAAMNQTRKGIFQASDDYNHVAYEAASAARFAMENTSESLDMADPEVQGLVAMLVSAGIFLQAAADDLYARVTTLQSPAAVAGASFVKRGWVTELRSN